MDSIKEAFEYFDLKAPSVSSWSVGQQLEHILLANEFVLGQILSNYTRTSDRSEKTGWILYLILWTGYIPRGRGKSPKEIIPEIRSKQQLEKKLQLVEDLKNEVEKKRAVIEQSLYGFPHPLFGMMTVKQWLRFNDIHTRHHLKIIRDIVKSSH